MKTLITPIPYLLIFILSCSPQKQEVEKDQKDHLTQTTPEKVGMSSERISKIDNLIQDYIEKGWIPGAVGIVARHGKIVYHKVFGWRNIAQKDTLQKDDIFRIASMTKAITSVAVMMLYEDGKFLLDDPISKYIPEFKHPEVLKKTNPDSTYESVPAKNEITIRHLLTHTSGIGYGFINEELKPLYDKAGVPDGFVLSDAVLGDKIKALAKLPLLHEPGERFTYGLNADVLGYFVEVLSGKSFDEFLRDNIFDPLNMNDTYFFLPKDKESRLATIYAEDSSGIAPSEIESYMYPIQGSKSYYSGGAGLCSTAKDYMKFLQMLVNGGHYNGHQLLSPKTVDLIRTNQVGDKFGDNDFGLGFGITTKDTKYQMLSSIGNYWWGGYFHTHFWIDPKEDLTAVLMLQMNPVVHGNIADKFQILTYQSITELNN